MTSLPDREPGAEIAQKPVELILLRELASRLDMAVALFDRDRKLVYLNDAAEKLNALRLEDFGEISQPDLIALLRPTDSDGNLIPADRMPSGIALTGRRPEHKTVWMHDLLGGAHHCAVTALPLDTQGGAYIGAMVILWEIGGDEEPPSEP